MASAPQAYFHDVAGTAEVVELANSLNSIDQMAPGRLRYDTCR